LGLAGLFATNLFPSHRAHLELIFITVLICWFFLYDFWDFRYQPGFLAGVIASSSLHLIVLFAVWPLLPIHLILVLGIACIERFALMLVCFKLIGARG
jgi:hypothetical protein